jgi:hypothetical protein
MGNCFLGICINYLHGKNLKVIGIEVIKIMYLALKFGGFPIVALLYGINYKQYETFFEHHIDTVVMLTFGSGYVLADSLHDFVSTLTFQSSIKAIMWGICMVAVKSLLGVVFSAIGAWVVRIVSPYFAKKSEPLRRWLKKTIK